MDKIKEYFDSPRLSNSLLKKLRNPRILKLQKENPEIEDSDKAHFRIGAAVDCLLTSPERFEQDFKVVWASRPYGLMGKFVSNLPPGIDQHSPQEMYEEAYVKAGYKMGIGWVVSKFWSMEEAVNYYNATVNIPKGVVILPKEEEEQVRKIVELLTVGNFVTGYFINNGDENVDLLHQVPIYFDYLGVECKALLDGIRINHVEKTIEPFDLKTIGRSVFDFPSQYVELKYFQQAAFYDSALYTKDSPVIHLINEGYKVKDFVFIAVETKINSFNPAVIYVTDKDDIKKGIEGGYINGKYVPGINSLVEDYKWHVRNNYWDLPKDIALSDGRIPLKIFS